MGHRKDAAEVEAAEAARGAVNLGLGSTAEEAVKSEAAKQDDDQNIGSKTVAPTSLIDVLSATQREEVMKGDFSARTERMHCWLQRKFEAQDSDSLFYNRLCKDERLPAQHCREVKASCFFELLVLRTNSMVRLKQESPYEDIQIGQCDTQMSIEIQARSRDGKTK